jgi:hypothetical protein
LERGEKRFVIVNANFKIHKVACFIYLLMLRSFTEKREFSLTLPSPKGRGELPSPSGEGLGMRVRNID